MLDVLRGIAWKIRESFPMNRVVVLLTPFYAAAAGAIGGYIAQHAPWLSDFITPEQTKIVIAGAALGAIVQGYKWLDGWIKYEDRTASPLDQAEGPVIHEDDLAMETDDPEVGKSK